MRDMIIKVGQQQSESLSANQLCISNYPKSLGHFVSPKEPGKTQRSQLEEISNRFEFTLQQENLTVKEYRI
jgi:hypothetical protein